MRENHWPQLLSTIAELCGDLGILSRRDLDRGVAAKDKPWDPREAKKGSKDGNHGVCGPLRVPEPVSILPPILVIDRVED